MDKRCLVIGFDHEAVEKSMRLLESGAVVDIVSHGPASALDQPRNAGARIHDRPFTPEDITDQFLVILAIKTDPALTGLVHERCRTRRVLISAVDQVDFCDVVHVSLAEAGPLKVSVSTDGRAPALAKRFREDLEKAFAAQPLEAFVEHLSALRERLEREVPDLPERRKKLIAAAAGFGMKIEFTFPDAWENPPR